LLRGGRAYGRSRSVVRIRTRPDVLCSRNDSAAATPAGPLPTTINPSSLTAFYYPPGPLSHTSSRVSRTLWASRVQIAASITCVGDSSAPGHIGYLAACSPGRIWGAQPDGRCPDNKLGESASKVWEQIWEQNSAKRPSTVRPGATARTLDQRIGQHGKVVREYLGGGVWLAGTRCRDADGVTRRVQRLAVPSTAGSEPSPTRHCRMTRLSPNLHSALSNTRCANRFGQTARQLRRFTWSLGSSQPVAVLPTPS